MSEQTGYWAHSTAIVDEGARVGKGTKIWHFTHVAQGAQIGQNCSLGQNVYVAPRARVGDNARIQNNVSLYDEVVLEDDVFCGPSAVFTNVINPRAHIPRKSEYKTTLAKKGATIGANATIVCGTTLGEYSFVAAGAVVTKDVLPYELVGGVPAKRLGWMCQCGVRLANADGPDSRVVCAACGATYLLDSRGLRQK